MIEAARRNKRVVQVGTQSRSTAHVRQAMEKLHGGAIGDVLVSKAWNSQRRGSIGRAKPSDPPSTLDYDLWLGPAPEVPYQSNLLPGIWRWWHNFGAGDMGNDGVHDIDIACWGLGVDTHPSSVVALGGKYFFDDDQQFPDTQYVVFEYPGDGKVGHKRQLIFEQRIWSPYVQEGFENGNAFYGTQGMMLLGKRGGYKTFGPRNKLIEEVTTGEPDLAAHHQDFIECVRTGGRSHADIEINHRSSALCHLGNIATRVAGPIQFDPQSERITNNPDADSLVRRLIPVVWPRTVLMIYVAAVGVIVIHMTTIAVVVVYMTSIRVIVIDMTAPLVGVVRKDRNSEDERSREDCAEDAAEKSCFHETCSFPSSQNTMRSGKSRLIAEHRRWCGYLRSL
jgi:predicted dehydrogenase